MDKVLQFVPTAQALENIPHMLRYWAGVIERDQAAGKEFDVGALVLVERGDPTPAFFVAGTPHSAPQHPLFIAGVFDYCRMQMLTVAEPETTP